MFEKLTICKFENCKNKNGGHRCLKKKKKISPQNINRF